MEIKVFEVRDSMTFIPVVCVRFESKNEAQRYLLARGGWGRSNADLKRHVVYIPVGGGVHQAHSDPCDWPRQPRTHGVAHSYIAVNFDALEDGAVIDVEYILGEKPTRKESESKDNAHL